MHVFKQEKRTFIFSFALPCFICFLNGSWKGKVGNAIVRFVFKLGGRALKMFNSCSSQLPNSSKPKLQWERS